jgi:U3 small nucleolar RNA-associated protein 10
LREKFSVSGNPQTFHQALLLIANLARLAPDSVLYNVMPVFTFMGSNVFHRDDSYSFKVVQQVNPLFPLFYLFILVAKIYVQTIDGIVPVMVSSLKEVHPQSHDLYIASKEFLRVFTDAANHIPRHRRNKSVLTIYSFDLC